MKIPEVDASNRQIGYEDQENISNEEQKNITQEYQFDGENEREGIICSNYENNSSDFSSSIINIDDDGYYS